MATDYWPPIEPPSFDDYFDEDGKFDYEKCKKMESEYVQSLATLARENGSSELLGEVIRWQRGDGYAWYMVWDTKPLELIFIPLGDAYQVEEPLIRGLTLSDVKEMISRERVLAKIFS